MSNRTMLFQLMLGLGILLVVFAGVTGNEALRTWGLILVGVSLVLILVFTLLQRR